MARAIAGLEEGWLKLVTDLRIHTISSGETTSREAGEISIGRQFMERAAIISPCGRYRYSLQRRWRSDGAELLWLLLNPSVADENKDDPTMIRCIRFADRWGYGAIRVINLFALRATNPKSLYTADAPVGPDNDRAIIQALGGTEASVCAWGNHGRLHGRGAEVMDLLVRHGCKPRIFRLTRRGEPMHLLYLSYSAPTYPYDGGDCSPPSVP